MQPAVTYVHVSSLACKFASLPCRLSHPSGSLLTLSTSCVPACLMRAGTILCFPLKALLFAPGHGMYVILQDIASPRGETRFRNPPGEFVGTAIMPGAPPLKAVRFPLPRLLSTAPTITSRPFLHRFFSILSNIYFVNAKNLSFIAFGIDNFW